MTESKEASRSLEGLAGRILFLASLVPLLAFIAALFVFEVFRWQDGWVPGDFFSAKKVSEIVFYGGCSLGVLLLFFYPQQLLSSRLIPGGKAQSLAVLALLFWWHNIYDNRHPLFVFVPALALLAWKVTVPSLKGTLSPLIERWVEKHFPQALLFIGTAASVASATSGSQNKFFVPLLMGTAALLLLKSLTWFTVPPLKLGKTSAVISCLILLLSALPSTNLMNWYTLSSVLGPVIDDLNGRMVGVDVESQYGWGAVWFLALAMKLMGGITLTKAFVFHFIFWVGSLVLIPWALWSYFRSFSVAVLALFFSVCFGVWSFNPWTYSFFSQGPLRFGFYLLFLIPIALKKNHPEKASAIEWLEALIVGISSFWALESFVFTLFPFLCLALYERRLLRSSLKAFLLIALVWVAGEARIWSQSGHLADPRLFMEYVTINVVDAFSAYNFSVSGVWTLMWLLLATSVCLSWGSFMNRQRDSLFIFTTASFYVTISYFVNRSIDAIFIALAPIIGVLCAIYFCRIIPKRYFWHSSVFLILICGFFLNSRIEGSFIGSPIFTAVAWNSKGLVQNSAKALVTGRLDPFTERDPCTQDLAPEISLVKELDRSTGPLWVLSNCVEEVTDFTTSICTGRPNGFGMNPAEVTKLSARASALKLTALKRRVFQKDQVFFIHNDLLSEKYSNARWPVCKDMWDHLRSDHQLSRLKTQGVLTAFVVE